MRLTIVAVALAFATGCAGTVNNFTINRVMDRSLKVEDAQVACETGISQRNLLAAVTSEKHPPKQALIAAEASAAICEELLAMELELDRMAFKKNMVQANGDTIALLEDMRIAEERYHQRVSARYLRAYRHFEELWGPASNFASCFSKVYMHN